MSLLGDTAGMPSSAQASSSIGVSLVLVDVQNDFLPGGSLAVPSSSKILPPILALLTKQKYWASIVATQDYHPPDHISFADNHEGADAFKPIQVEHPLLGRNGEGEKIEQMMWPRHCVQGTPGCQIHEDIWTRLADLRQDGEDVVVVRKVSDEGIKELDASIMLLTQNYSARETIRKSTDTRACQTMPTRDSRPS